MRQYRSRLNQIEEKKSIKTAVLYGGLTVIIIIAAIFFGIPLFAKFTSLFVKQSSPITNSSTQTLLTPSLSTIPKYTKNQSIIVKGTGEPNSTIKIFFNNSSDEITTDSDGNFTANIGLTKGANTIYAQTIDDKGNTSGNSNSYTITYLNQVPNLTVNVPQNNQSFYGSSQQNLEIQGSTDAINTVTINDRIAIVDSEGKFSYTYPLQNGDNNLKIKAVDPAGNNKEIDLKVTFNP